MVEFKNVTMVYKKGAKPALDNVSFKVEDGEFVFITGRSGAGKSTMVHLLTCENVVTDGLLTVDGQELKKISHSHIPKYRRSIGIVFQDFKLLPQLNVEDNIAFAMRVVGNSSVSERKTRVASVLELVDLKGKEKSFPDELSGGEQQRVALARAIVNSPRMIIADEPTGSVDVSLAKNMMKLLVKYNKISNATVIVVTHEQDIVDALSKREIRIAEGRIEFDSAAETNEVSSGSEQSASDPEQDEGKIRKRRQRNTEEEQNV